MDITVYARNKQQQPWLEWEHRLKPNCILLGWLSFIAGKSITSHTTQTEHNTAFQQHSTPVAVDFLTKTKQIKQAVTNTSSCTEQIYNQTTGQQIHTKRNYLYNLSSWKISFDLIVRFQNKWQQYDN